MFAKTFFFTYTDRDILKRPDKMDNLNVTLEKCKKKEQIAQQE